MHLSPSQRATARVQFVCYLRLSAPRHSERPSSASAVHGTYPLASAAKRCVPSSTPSYRAITSSRSLLRRRRTPARKIHCIIWPCCGRLHGVWFTGHRFPPADVRLRQRRRHAFVKFNLCMPRAALATKMMVVLWNRGTCSHTAKMCAVAPPLCRLYKKTLPVACVPCLPSAGRGAGFAYSG